MIISLIGAFLTSVSFGYLFNVQRKELLYCGITGLIGFFILLILSRYFDIASIFIATTVVTITSIALSKIRKTISTNYLTTGIIPFVPGGLLYRTMYYTVYNEWENALYSGFRAFMTAGAIAFGVIFVVSIYNVLYLYNSKRA